ncbi:MAG: rhodanese-like domain-containing protein [Saprospiraceae bacterium]|nr:rhodanese-like domain-containing protein [Saprospiraceae bacterium]MCB0627191.1 rhodanese-like domain-containing protein [Saprospiraceae bacterium]MCB0678849.1 rhodanese-like domain-containing protein [Saprospiraceae bacterium]MCB0681637.1 rhodanese-like domain-containing protein [Saprospiraceae bacterium]
MDPSCKTSRWQLLKSQLKNLPPVDFLEAIRRSPEAIVLDVRTPEEMQSGAPLERAVGFDYLSHDFIDRLEQLDPKQTYYVYCRSGRRSTRVCTLLKNTGFEQVYNLDGGLKSMQSDK